MFRNSGVKADFPAGASAQEKPGGGFTFQVQHVFPEDLGWRLVAEAFARQVARKCSNPTYVQNPGAEYVATLTCACSGKTS